MTQNLILPINDAKLTASWKTVAYQQKFGLIHYGADLISRSGNPTVFASGKGKILAAGRDSVVGNVVAVHYPGARNSRTGVVRDMVFRYFHLAGIYVRVGQAVTKDTVLGLYGNTGALTMGKHLHLEADADTAHPLHSPTVFRSGLLMGRALGATDNTMSNPLEWLYYKTSPPDRQLFTTAGDSFVRAEDQRIISVT